MPIIELKNICKEYRTKIETLKILKNINLKVEKGEFITILGKSGSGKTTLLNILGLLDDKTSGQYIIDNKDITNLKGDEVSDIRNLEIGYVFQFHHLLNEFTALENVMLPAMTGKYDITKIKKRALELLEMVELSDRINHKPDELSGGEKQRVAIARSLINRPAIVLCDEPTGNLDIETSKIIHNLFLKINKEYNQTYIVVTHSLELAKISDKVYKLVNGEIYEENI